MLYRHACRKIAGYDALWPGDRFVQMAMEWLIAAHGWIKILRDEWNEEGTGKVIGWTVQIPELSPDNSVLVCCGETLIEALIAAVDSTEVQGAARCSSP